MGGETLRPDRLRLGNEQNSPLHRFVVLQGRLGDKHFLVEPFKTLVIHICMSDFLNVVRYTLLVETFAASGRCQDGRMGIGEWAKATGVSRPFLSPVYQAQRSPELFRHVIEFAAKARSVEPDRLWLWLFGAPDPALESHLNQEIRKLRCTGDGPHLESTVLAEPGWFDQEADVDLIIPALRKCKMCARRRHRDDSPDWEEKILNSNAIPTKIRHAIACIRAAGKAVTYKAIEQEARLPYPEVRKMFARAGLEKPREGRFRPARYKSFLPIAVLLRTLSGSPDVSAATPAATKHIIEIVHLVERRRRDWSNLLDGKPVNDNGQEGRDQQRAA